MSKIKDPQITLVGWIKPVGEPANRHNIVVVSLPPKIDAVSGKLVEKTLLVNLPDANYSARTECYICKTHCSIHLNSYLKSHLFDERVENDRDNRNRNKNDHQVVLTGLIKPVDGGHQLIVIDLPTEDGADRTLLVNVPKNEQCEPSNDDYNPEVLCYLKYKVAGERHNRRFHSSTNQPTTTNTTE